MAERGGLIRLSSGVTRGELPVGRSSPFEPGEGERLIRRAKLLAWGGNAWHLVEFAIAVAAGSIALIGFGADSLIEAASGLVVVWLFTGRRLGSARAERRAQQLVAAR